MEVTRRRFLGTSAAAILAGTVGTTRAFGANDRIRMCCIGLNGRGRSHIDGFTSNPGSEVVALCDVDSEVLAERAAQLEAKTGKKPKTYRDMREVMADSSIDAVSVATPNHWHTLAAIWACQAGKDVYVEKPLSHNIFEGRQLVEAAKKHGRVVQHGTQSRSSDHWIRNIRLLHSGFIGDVYMAKGFTYKTGNRESIGMTEFKEPPERLDWKLWQGPATDQKYCDNYVHYNWHWFWNYGNGEFGNQLVHQMDIGVWGINSGLPVKAQSLGGRYVWNDQGQTPNTQVTTFTYANGKTLLMEVRNLGSYPEEGSLETGNTFWGEKGYFVEGKGFFNHDHKEIEAPEDKVDTEGCWGNFLRTVRSRKPEDNPADALAGHISSAHCHIGNLAYRLGRTLEFDPKAERFVNDDEANKMLTRDYREGFEVPKLAGGNA